MTSPRTLAGLGIVALLAGAGAVASGPRTGAATGAPPRQPAEVGIRIELVEQAYAFGPDQSLHLVYELTGDLPSLQLEPPTPDTTAPDATTPDTTTPATATPDTAPTASGEPAPPDTMPAAPTSEAAPATTVPPPALLQLAVQVTNYPPLTAADTPRDVESLVGGDVNRDGFGVAVDGIEISDARPLIVFDADGTARLTLDIPTDSVTDSVGDRLKFETPGLYPIRTELLVGTFTGGLLPVGTHGTIVQRLPADGSSGAPTPVDLSIVTAVQPATDDSDESATDDSTTDPSNDTTTDGLRAEADEQFAAIVDFARAVTAPITLDVSPPIVVDATSTPDDAAAVAEALAGDEFVAVPAVPLDVSSAVEVDRTDEFARLLSAGEDLLTRAVPSTPSRRNAWIVLEPLSGAGAQELRDLGVRFLVMSEAMYRATVDDTLPATDLFVDVALPDGATLPLLIVDSVSDDLTTEAADDILATSTPIEWAVSTVTSILLDDEGALERSRILSTPDLGIPDARLIGGLEAIAATTPSVEFGLASNLTGTTGTQLDDGRPVVVSLPEEAGPSLVERVALIDATALSAASAGSMLPEGDPRPDQWAAELDALLTTAIDDAEAAAVTAEIQAEADAIRGSVVPPTPFTFTLTGRSGDIEIQVGNTSADPLDIVLRFSSPKLSFPESTPPPDDPAATDVGDHTVTLRPNDETSVVIPVKAKSNGTSPITVEVLTPAGEVIGNPVTITSRVTAFTGLGQVLTAAFILVLLTWWFAHWRSKRRANIEEGRDRHPSAAR